MRWPHSERPFTIRMARGLAASLRAANPIFATPIRVAVFAMVALSGPAAAQVAPPAELARTWEGILTIGFSPVPVELRPAQPDPITGRRFAGLELHWGAQRACKVLLDYVGTDGLPGIANYLFVMRQPSGGFCYRLRDGLVAISRPERGSIYYQIRQGDAAGETVRLQAPR